MVFVRLLSKLLRDKEIGKLVVPIVSPTSALHLRYGSAVRQVSIYSHAGQVYGSRSTWIRSSTTKRPTVGSSRKASTEAVRSRRSLPPARQRHHGVNDSVLHLLFVFGFQLASATDLGRRRRPARIGFLLGGTAMHDPSPARPPAPGR